MGENPIDFRPLNSIKLISPNDKTNPTVDAKTRPATIRQIGNPSTNIVVATVALGSRRVKTVRPRKLVLDIEKTARALNGIVANNATIMAKSGNMNLESKRDRIALKRKTATQIVVVKSESARHRRK
jgi:hypothetical protein